MIYDRFTCPDAPLSPPDEGTKPRRCPNCHSKYYGHLMEQTRQGHFETFIIGCDQCIRAVKEDG